MQSILAESLRQLPMVAVMTVVWYITFIAQSKSDERRREADEKKREEDRKEHMVKWASMVEQNKQAIATIVSQYEKNIDMMSRTHSDEKERVLKLMERQTTATELHARLLVIIDQKIDTNQYCPIKRKEG